MNKKKQASYEYVIISKIADNFSPKDFGVEEYESIYGFLNFVKLVFTLGEGYFRTLLFSIHVMSTASGLMLS